jgi:small subunit ribosomal protein S6
MLILNAEAPAERQQEILDRARRLITERGGVVHHVDEWGRRKIAYPMAKQTEGNYVVITCSASPDALEEMGRVFAINKDVVLRALPIRLTPSQAERARAKGAPAPVDERPEEPRAPRPGRGRRRGL